MAKDHNDRMQETKSQACQNRGRQLARLFS